MDELLPLAGIRCVEHASSVGAAYAGRLLAAMGADVIMVEPPGGNPLRREPPFLDDNATQSALFAYLSAGKSSVVCNLNEAGGRSAFDRLVGDCEILIDDTPVDRRIDLGLDRKRVAKCHPDIIHLSVLPFGATGPKAGWLGSELNLIHASGEGFLLPNGLSATLFPDRCPLKIAGHFAEMQGGVAAALSALSALWSGSGQFVDVAIQDAAVAVGAFTVQRYGDGSLEHRISRSFRYGGVIECADGYVELLTLEQHQWRGLVELMGYPHWAVDSALEDAAERSLRGDSINQHIREWARHKTVDGLVARAQELGVPMARYNSPAEVLAGKHEAARGLFAELPVAGGGSCMIQSAPFRFGDRPLAVRGWPSEPGADQSPLHPGRSDLAAGIRRESA